MAKASAAFVVALPPAAAGTSESDSFRFIQMKLFHHSTSRARFDRSADGSSHRAQLTSLALIHRSKDQCKSKKVDERSLVVDHCVDRGIRV